MLAGMSMGTDIKRYSRGFMPRLAIVAILFLPLMYGALYLWAFWNPFGHVNKIPAALVNEDQGAVVQGKPLQAGDQVVSQLVDSGQLDLHVTSAAEAAKGLENSDYYFTITIPKNFSKAIASPATLDAEQAQIVFTYDDKNSYLSRVIASDAAQQVMTQINAAIGAQIVDQALDAAKAAAPELKTAVDGINQLNAGMQQADSGSKQLAGATDQLNTALDQAADRIEALTAEGKPLSPEEVTKIVNDVDQVATRIADLPTVPEDIRALQSDVDDLAGRMDSGPIGQLVGAQLDAISARLGAAATQAETNPDAVEQVLQAIHDDAAKLADDIENPSSPVGKVVALFTQGGLQADLAKARGASKELNDGANQLSSGLDELAGGTDELAGKVNSAAGAIPDIDAGQANQLAKTLGQPVTLGQKDPHMAKTFGVGFAPFFLGLAMYVGGIITWMLIKPLQSRAVTSGLGVIRTALASYWPALVIGVTQATIMYLVLHFLIGLKPEYAWATFGFIILISATFMAMIQMFNALLGEAVGRVTTLAILMIMLVSSGGIYPVETTEVLFQWIHPYDPMTYSVNGLRELTVGGINGTMWQAVAVLAGITIVSLAITALSVRRNRQYTMARLFPPIEV